MKISRTYTLPYRRKRQQKTNYKKRLKLLASKKPRVVIRRSLSNVVVQFVEYHADGDKIVASAHSSELKKLGWKFATGNLPAAYLTGLLAGVKAKKAKVKGGVIDFGLYAPIKATRIYAAVKGVIDSGVDVPCSQEILPTDERVSGKHIADYAASLKGGETKQFSKADSANIVEGFAEIKDKILKM